MLRLISRFWWESKIVCRAAGFYGTLFKARQGVTQGDPLSQTIFNLMVDVIIREWEWQLIEKGLGLDNVRRLFAYCCADDWLLAARKPKQQQLAFNLQIALFDWVGLLSVWGQETVFCIFIFYVSSGI